jgi:nucleotide-binding universal stress UspA family protein
MGSDEAQKAWDRFESDIKGVAGELRRHYKNADDDTKRAELNRSLEQLRQAAEAVFTSLETATRDPEVRSKTKQATRSFGSALAETFRELGEEVDKVISKARTSK